MSKYERIKALIEQEIGERRIAAEMWKVSSGADGDRVVTVDPKHYYACLAQEAENRAQLLALHRRLVEMEPI